MIAFMALALAGTALTGCGGKEWDYRVSTKLSTLGIGDTTNVVVTCENKAAHTFTFDSTDATVASVTTAGVITGLKVGKCSIKVTADGNAEKAKVINIKVVEFEGADGPFTYAGESYETKGEILGKLEEYALKNHVSGLPLFENGGLVMYSDRVTKGTTNYITGYGFGILGEGNITAPLEKEAKNEWKMYYHSAASSDPFDINDWDADGSQVSDLASYIRSSYFDIKMNSTKDGYDWYPVLAKEMPVAMNPAEDGRATTWKFKVRTGDDGLKYATNSNDADLKKFNGRGVALEDYIYTFQMLLTGKYNLYRGAELAGQTDVSGFVGASKYFNATKSTGEDPELFADTVHIAADPSTNELYFEFLGPVTQFYAMYYLASGLYQPIPKDFITAVGGPLNYGRPVEGTSWTPVDTALSLAPYTLEYWEEGVQTTFKRNPDWFQFSIPELSNRYKIEGVHIRVNTAIAQDPNAAFNMFLDGQTDASSIPSSFVSQYKNDPRTTTTTGDSVFKLNVNSCNEEQWEEKFGENGTICRTAEADYWDVKPWMGNSWFLDGIFLSLNRQEFADNRGMIPSANYFASAYLIDPEEGISYNNTQAHKDAVSEYYPETHGYNLEAARQCFQEAVNELVNDGDLVLGTPEKPTEISFKITWMYESDKTEYGNDIINYIEKAFNDASVCGNKVKLKVEQDAVAVWSDVYYKVMMKGQFDLAFGSISGNTLNPLNFMEVLKSDNSSGFTLNWGVDTNACTIDNCIEYDDKFWSFDALWAAGDHGALVSKGCNVNPVDIMYVDFNIPGNMQRAEDGSMMLYIDVYTCAGIDGDKVDFFFEDFTIYDGVHELSFADFYIGGATDPEDETHSIVGFSFPADAVAQLDAILSGDYELEEVLPLFSAEGLAEGYFEFVIYYGFTVLGITSDLYFECPYFLPLEPAE